MISGVSYFHSGLSPRVEQRVQELGMSVIDLSSNGKATPIGGVCDGVNVLLESDLFQSCVAKNWETIVNSNTIVNEIWPGLIVANLPLRKRRRMEQRFVQRTIAIIIVSKSIQDSIEFTDACKQVGVNQAYVYESLKPQLIASCADAERMAMMLRWMQEDVTEIDRRLGELNTMSGELSESYEELSLLYKLSVNMKVNQEPDEFLKDACRELQQVVGVNWLAIQLIDEDPRLEDLSGHMILAGDSGCSSSCVHEAGKYLIVRMSNEDHSVVFDDTTKLHVPLLPRLAKQMMVVPIRFEGKTLGIMFGGDKLDGTHISSIDIKLCDSLVNSMAIFLGNMMLYEDANAMFIGTLHALTSAIDAKDSYTHGHSERVAFMSRMLAEEAGLDPQLVERTYVAGLLHDVGKIGVPESVLCKPGRLTTSEFTQIKLHPEIGAKILSDIRQMKDLIPGVLCHHERWDGKGYPSKLAGDDIPIMGRVIGLADAFDAMSSNRTYRKAMDINEVLEEIKRCSGEQFDPHLVDVLVKMDFEPFLELISKHQTERTQRKIA